MIIIFRICVLFYITLLIGCDAPQTVADKDLKNNSAVKTVKAIKISSSDTLKLIKEKGAEKALEILFNDNKKWDQVWNGIKSGDPEWLKVAVKLQPVSDGGASEMLHSAVSNGLINAPERILSLPEKLFPLGASCYWLQFDIPEYGNIELLNRKEKAVRGIKNTRLHKKKMKCLEHIKKAKKEIIELEKSNKE